MRTLVLLKYILGKSESPAENVTAFWTLSGVLVQNRSIQVDLFGFLKKAFTFIFFLAYCSNNLERLSSVFSVFKSPSN